MKDTTKPRSPLGFEANRGERKGPLALTETLAERVRQQRRHIERLTGQDPLRAGIAD